MTATPPRGRVALASPGESVAKPTPASGTASTWPPSDLAPLGPLGRILLARHELATARSALHEAIADARDHGHTWPQIARLLRED